MSNLRLTISGNKELNDAVQKLQDAGYVVVAEHEVALLRGRYAVDTSAFHRARTGADAERLREVAILSAGRGLAERAIKDGFFKSEEHLDVHGHRQVFTVDLYTIKPVAGVPRRVVADYGDLNGTMYA